MEDKYSWEDIRLGGSATSSLLNWMTHAMTKEEVSHQLVSRSKILWVVSQELSKWCHSIIWSDVHKNARFKCQPSTPMQPFVSIDAHLIWNLMTKEERLVQRYWGKLDLDMNMDKEGVTLKNVRGSKFLDKRSTQVGGVSSWTWSVAFDMCILTCFLALHKF